MIGLLLGIVLLVCICWFHNIVTLYHWLSLLILTDAHTSVFFVQLCPCFIAYVEVLLLLLLLLF